MISVCIPIYNYDVRELVSELYAQLKETDIAHEILLMDDASSDRYRAIHAGMASYPTVRYIQLNKNIGRSKIRNRLAVEAAYPYLIFMDCDSEIAGKQYIRNYLSILKPGIVCSGGHIYDLKKPDQKKYFHWKYGIARESKTAEQRRAISNFGFGSTNFLIDKHIFEQVRFDESLEGYGHEDTFFGIQLLIRGISIEHIDNPTLHKGLEDAEVFLAKTENAVCNLHQVRYILNVHYPEYARYSKLLKMTAMIEKLKLTFLIRGIFCITRSALKKNLLGKKPSLLLFDLYKLGFFYSINREY